jgi:hypothetical protein
MASSTPPPAYPTTTRRWRDGWHFLTMDPFYGVQEDPQSFHKYLYTPGDPINYIDPSGRSGDLVSTQGSMTTVSQLAAQQIAAIPAAARAAFAVGGAAIGRFYNQFGPMIQKLGDQVMSLIPGITQLGTKLTGFTRVPDWDLKTGEKLMTLEGKYRLPSLGEPLSRLGAQLQQFTQWSSQGPGREVVVWALREPENVAKAEEVVLRAAGNPQGVRFVYGIEGLYNLLMAWVGL